MNRGISMKREKPSMRELVFAVGGIERPGENRKSWLARVARAAGISPRSAAAAFYGELRGEIHRAGVESKLRAAAGQQEAKDLAARFENLATALDRGDADFHCDTIAALVGAARILRGLDSARDHRAEVASSNGVGHVSTSVNRPSN
jgi:hypothetical protein